MPTRKPFHEGAYYHVYNRGTEKRRIFEDPEDWRRFMITMAAANGQQPVSSRGLKEKTFEEVVAGRGDTLVDITNHCLMPNHFHFIVRAKSAAGVSKFLQKQLTSYASYFNLKHNRSGTLFQGRTKAKLIKNQSQLLTAIAYLNENPLEILSGGATVTDRRVAEDLLATYAFSSYLDYARPEAPRPERLILNMETLPPDAGKILEFRRGPTSGNAR